VTRVCGFHQITIIIFSNGLWVVMVALIVFWLKYWLFVSLKNVSQVVIWCSFV